MTITNARVQRVQFDLGDKGRARVTFKDPDNNDALVDPDTVKVTVTDPSGTSTTYVYGTDSEVVKESTGTYRIDIDLNAKGDWIVRWHSEGNGQAAVVGIMEVIDGTA